MRQLIILGSKYEKKDEVCYIIGSKNKKKYEVYYIIGSKKCKQIKWINCKQMRQLIILGSKYEKKRWSLLYKVASMRKSKKFVT